MEACGSAHYWARQFQGFGHDVKLLPPLYVRPYVQRSKTDRADVKGMLEAWRNSDIRPVPVKTESQQQRTSLHRIRSGWMAGRTMRINSARGLLREFGVVFPLGRHFACYLGLTPREHSSGGRRRLGRISKQGDVYLRMLLIHGARAVLWSAKSKSDPGRFFSWALDVEQRRGHNKAATAVANKMARIVWAVWKFGKPFQSPSQASA